MHRFIHSRSKCPCIPSDIQFKPLSYPPPIEIALGIDADGMTTARKLYEFLELNPAHYARWCKTNITENPFAEEGVDYFHSPSMASKQKRGNFAQDFKLTANFAKKLSMQGKTERAEQARDYFIKVEDSFKLLGSLFYAT